MCTACFLESNGFNYNKFPHTYTKDCGKKINIKVKKTNKLKNILLK